MNLLCIKNTVKEKIIEKKSTTKTMINQPDFETIKNNTTYINIFQKNNPINYNIKQIKKSFSQNNISYIKRIFSSRELYSTNEKIENLKINHKPKYINNKTFINKKRSFLEKSRSKTCSSELVVIDYPNSTEEKNKIKTNILENGNNTNEIINNNINNFKGDLENIKGDSDITEMHNQDFENNIINSVKKNNIPYCFMKINENKFFKKMNTTQKYNQHKKTPNLENKNIPKNNINNYSNLRKNLINMMPIKFTEISQKNYNIKKYNLDFRPKSRIRRKNKSQNILSRTIKINDNINKQFNKKGISGNIFKKKTKNKSKINFKNLCNKYINSKKNNAKIGKINLNYLFVKNNEIPTETANFINSTKKYGGSSRKIQSKKLNLLKSDNLQLFKNKLAKNKKHKYYYLNTQIPTNKLKKDYKIKSIIKKNLTISENLGECEIEFQKNIKTENFDDKNQTKKDILTINSSIFNTIQLANIKDIKNSSRTKNKIGKNVKDTKNENSSKNFGLSKNNRIKFDQNKTCKTIRIKGGLKKNK